MTDIKRIIRGAKGGNPTPPQPTRDPIIFIVDSMLLF